MKTLFHFVTAAFILASGIWYAQPVKADEYRCTDRESGDWFTTDRDQTDDDISCRRQGDFYDRARDDDYRDYRNDDDFSDDDRNLRRNYPRDDYTRGYDDACEDRNPETFENNREYAEGYQDAERRRCSRPRRWQRD